MDNVNLRKINGYTVQQMTTEICAIDEFGTDLMYLVTGREKAMLVDHRRGDRGTEEDRRTAHGRPVFVVNTHGHMDHAMGNREFRKRICTRRTGRLPERAI